MPRAFAGTDLPGCGRSFAYRDDPGLVLAREFAEQVLEVLGLAEIAIDRGEAHIGDVVERAQMLPHGPTDRLRPYRRPAAAFQLAHDVGNHLLDPLGLDRALAQGD